MRNFKLRLVLAIALVACGYSQLIGDEHWAYQPLSTNVPPLVEKESWVLNDIDRFVLARLESQGIAPSVPADRYKLVKRLYYDLLGLLPSIEEVDTFVHDNSPVAYAALVDRLLASPHFGERWGRHWLDKARYADSDGYEKDNNRPNAWHYRDWVINTINGDLPLNHFVIQQLAGDLLPNATQADRLATAFHRQTLTNTEGGTDPEEWRVAAVMDRVETVGTVWLGLTVGCARCHDHKYDDISQQEYYKLYAFFNNGDEASMKLRRSHTVWQAYVDNKERYEQEIQQLTTKLAKAKQDASTDTEVIANELKELEQQSPKPPYDNVRILTERIAGRRQTRLLHRGDFLQPQQEVTANTLGALPDLKSRDDAPSRLDLAHWLVNGTNPLPPRVMANHIWAHLFGEGLVPTMEDFGVRGEPPTHPQLLDWLAQSLIDNDWSRKKLIRTIVLSATYRQDSIHRPELADIDPTNRLLYRQNRFRVESEIVRDVHLSAGGLLCDKVGGPSVYPPIPSSITELTYNSSFQWPTSKGEDRYRRGMYTFFKRTAPHPNLTTFDCPDSLTTTVERGRSNTPIAALVTLNNEVFVEAARGLARRVLTEADGNDRERLKYAFRLCVARPPNDAELGSLANLLQSTRGWYSDHPSQVATLVDAYHVDNIADVQIAAWIATARIILNLDEFITRE